MKFALLCLLMAAHSQISIDQPMPEMTAKRAWEIFVIAEDRAFNTWLTLRKESWSHKP